MSLLPPPDQAVTLADEECRASPSTSQHHESSRHRTDSVGVVLMSNRRPLDREPDNLTTNYGRSHDLNPARRPDGRAAQVIRRANMPQNALLGNPRGSSSNGGGGGGGSGVLVGFPNVRGWIYKFLSRSWFL